MTAPAPGSDTTVKLLAIADLGFCEEDGSMTWPGNYPNAVAVEPVGTDVEIISEVCHPLTCAARRHYSRLKARHTAACMHVRARGSLLIVSKEAVL